MKIVKWCLWLAMFVVVGVQAAETAATPHVRVSWLAPQSFGPGTTRIGVAFDMQPGWHIYHREPGDVGAPPSFDITVQGASLGEPLWPVPVRLEEAGIVSNAYSDRAVIMWDVAIAPGAESVAIEAKIDWVVCKEECIPEAGTIELRRPVGATTQWAPGVKDQIDTANTKLEIQKNTTPVVQNIWVILALALAGGVILNLMPCVLPVLSIKFLSLVKYDEADRRRECLLYTLGVVVSFVGLGLLLLGLREVGNAVGWGYQLQEPLVILGLILLFWLMALNFAGLYEWGGGLTRLLGGASSGSFATGVLSVFVAAPCTAPFMGTALGAAAVLPAASALTIFFCLGVGLALPFILLAYWPAVGRYLPRPGDWMIKLREFFAFPLFATVLWLIWVLSIQTGIDGAVAAAVLLLAVAFALWLGKVRGRWAVWLAWGLAIASLAMAIVQIRSLEQQSKPELATTALANESLWQPYSPQAVDSARAHGRPVFIDFTAAWCITCQVNKRLVLDTPQAKELYRAHNIALLQADWTRQDPQITAALASYGRSSVPLYVYYAVGSNEPKILPAILTLDILQQTISQTK